ncbi:lipopolysaccharide biosynthesis protein [Gordonia sp. NPDC003504]
MRSTPPDTEQTGTGTVPDESSVAGPDGRRNVIKAGVAALWAYGGRAAGLLWTIIVVAHLGVGSYGQYAMGFALGAIIAAPLDNPFNVRAIRESYDRFLSERATRSLLGITLMLAGAACVPFSYLAWFALAVGGGEIAFNAVKSGALRDGHPDRVMRLDTIRQGSSIALGAGYLLLAPQPGLEIASALYAAPYVIVALWSTRLVVGHRLGIPGNPRLIALLFSEHLANAAYMQGDILLLGALTDSDIAGYYAIASTVGWAAAQLGMALGNTYHEPLRAAGGALEAGPPRSHIAGVAALTSGSVMAAGLILLAFPVSEQLAWSLVIIGVFVAMRVVNFVLMTVLYVQRRDLVRSAAAAVLAPIKLLLVFALAGWGSIGACVASVVTDAVLLVIYLAAVRRPLPAVPSEPDMAVNHAAGLKE